MNFKDKYKNELDPVSADETVKNNVRRALRREPSSPAKRSHTFPLRAAAVSLCAVLLFAAGFWLFPKKSNAPVHRILVEKASSYGEIYNAVKKLRRDDRLLIRNYKSDDEVVTYGAVEESAPDAAVGEASFSTTTKQVEGVDEADIVKTDGRYIYRLGHDPETSSASLVTVDTKGSAPQIISSLSLSAGESRGFATMYVAENRLILIGRDYSVPGPAKSLVAFYDISDRSTPTLIAETLQCGNMTDSRLVGDTLYLLSNYYINGGIDEEDPSSFVPFVECNGEKTVTPADSVCIYENCSQPVYTVVCGYRTETGALLDTKSVLGGSYAVYCNTKNLLAAGYELDGKTQLVRFALEKGGITPVANGSIAGSLLNQFSMDEYNGYFRFVTTAFDQSKGQTVNALTVLDGDLKQTGKIDDLAPGERVYSVRFMGDTGYFVTFRQVDPLFSADLSDPADPRIIGALKIPGFSDYLFPYGEGKLLGIGKNADERTGATDKMKLSLFDISDPANVAETFKADVPAFDSEALYNHKACLADGKKNLIGFSGYYDDFCYYLYTLKEDGFVLLASIPLKEKAECRGLYIGSTFYIVGNECLVYFDLNHPDKVWELALA